VLAGCRHPLDVVGEGDIFERRLGERGCTLEESLAGGTRCVDNAALAGDYRVSFEAVARPGWRFDRWEGTACGPDSASTYCEYDVDPLWVGFVNAVLPGYTVPPTTAVFTPLDADGDGLADADDLFPTDPAEQLDSDCDGIGDNADPVALPLVATLQGQRCAEGVHLFVLADGYTEAEQDKLLRDADAFLEFILDDPGIAGYVAHWNVHVILTVSAQSGSDPEYGVDTVDTAFDSGFNCSGVKRLLCADESSLYDELLRVTSDVLALAVLMVNAKDYGGSGGDIPMFSTGAPEVALHEMGHSFADLADEYVDEAAATIFAPFWQDGRYANVARENMPGTVPWRLWIDDPDDFPSEEGEPGVGIFEGGYYHRFGYYRPLDSSRMLSNNADFGPVNSEAWIVENYRRETPVRKVAPAASAVALDLGAYQGFGVAPQFSAALQDFSWRLDGVLQRPEVNTPYFTFFAREPGSFTLSVEVTDGTGALRRDDTGVSRYSRSWQITVAGP
jgi:hypothetical protein